MFPHLAVAVAMAIRILAAIRRAGVRHCRDDDMIWNGDAMIEDREFTTLAHEASLSSISTKVSSIPRSKSRALTAAGLSGRQS